MSNATSYNPASSWLDEPRAYSGVRTRRSLAFLVDYSIVLLLCIPMGFLIGVLGILTLGLGWMLYAIIFPLVALPYVTFTLGGSSQATPGMRLFDLRLERLDGRRVDPALGAAHSILFWAAGVLTSGFIVLLALFTPRKQLLQDLLLGTVVVRRS
ncbi:RDD family protein [Aureimonas ureilytica]|uniref:RDD family protein n=1 Tax=Aureimonas ureilytica TaxID=401562 RepID=UPI000379C7CB|nr:RDD family protein [Aureimonas ureilytica]